MAGQQITVAVDNQRYVKALLANDPGELFDLPGTVFPRITRVRRNLVETPIHDAEARFKATSFHIFAILEELIFTVLRATFHAT